MQPAPAGLSPVEGIPRIAQAIFHRELLHVHGILEMTLALLRFRFAIASSISLDQITSHVLTQLRGLDSALLQSVQAVNTGLYYTQERLDLLTALGMMQILTPAPISLILGHHQRVHLLQVDHLRDPGPGPPLWVPHC